MSWYGKSLSAGSYKVSSIDLSINKEWNQVPAYNKGVKPKRYTSDNNNHLLHLCHCWSRTTRKGRVYENATKGTKTLLCTQMITWPFQALLWEHHLLWLYSIAQLIQATTAPPPPPFKPRLLVAHTDGWLSVINDTSIMTTWMTGYQLSTIRVLTTWVKGCQSLTIQ